MFGAMFAHFECSTRIESSIWRRLLGCVLDAQHEESPCFGGLCLRPSGCLLDAQREENPCFGWLRLPQCGCLLDAQREENPCFGGLRLVLSADRRRGRRRASRDPPCVRSEENLLRRASWSRFRQCF